MNRSLRSSGAPAAFEAMPTSNLKPPGFTSETFPARARKGSPDTAPVQAQFSSSYPADIPDPTAPPPGCSAIQRSRLSLETERRLRENPATATFQFEYLRAEFPVSADMTTPRRPDGIQRPITGFAARQVSTVAKTIPGRFRFTARLTAPLSRRAWEETDLPFLRAQPEADTSLWANAAQAPTCPLLELPQPLHRRLRRYASPTATGLCFL